MATSRIRSRSFAPPVAATSKAGGNGLPSLSRIHSRRKIQDIVDRINEKRNNPPPGKEPSFKTFLGGEWSTGGFEADDRGALQGVPTYKGKKTHLFKMGGAEIWDTGVDVNELIDTNPFGRYKFYLSLSLRDQQSNEKAVSFIRDLYRECKANRISLGTKSHDHDYDSLDIYTFHPQEMSDILKKLYNKYPDIWKDSLHPIQGKVGDIPAEHIGVVQEPVMGFGGSHSSRAQDIGSILDRVLEASSRAEINVNEFAEACKEVGVLPHAPWLIDPSQEMNYLERFGGKLKPSLGLHD